MLFRLVLIAVLLFAVAFLVKGSLKRWVGFLLIAIGGLTIAALLLSRMSQSTTLERDDILTLAIGFALLPLGVGGFMVFKANLELKQQQFASHQRRLIMLAKTQNGLVTAIDASQELNLSVEQARQVLQQLQLHGVFGMYVDEKGILIYELQQRVR